MKLIQNNLLDVPSPPRPPLEVSGLTKDSFILSWTEPDKDGGSKILDYEVHIRDETTTEWKYIGRTEGNQTYIHVRKLEKKKKYWFKISARNDAGLSLPLLSDEPITLAKRISKFNTLYTAHNQIPYQQNLIFESYFVHYYSTTFTTTKSKGS